MSHFATLVLINSRHANEPEKAVTKLLAPYNENEDVENPRWDWWQIGGRWTGALDGYDPETDPLNRKVCTLCKGTGKRTDMVVAMVANGCNGCNGTGVETLWPTSWARHAGDLRPVSFVLDRIRSGAEVDVYAVVTPDGEWHARGEMGWFGISRDDDDEQHWRETVRLLLEAHPKATAVMCDCHI